MSLITEALQKAEQEKVIKARRAREAALAQAAREAAEESENALAESLWERGQFVGAPAAGAGQSDRAGWRWRDPVIVGCVIAVILFALYLIPNWPVTSQGFSLNWNPFQNLGPAQAPRYVSSVPAQKPAAAPAVVAATSQAPAEAFQLPYQLSGVSLLGSDKYAFINGQIVSIGDSIDGAFVKEILKNEVILDTRAGEIRLKIPS